MSNPFGSNNHPLYDLSRILSQPTGAPSNPLIDAPIILVNPAITSGLALFSHTPQPFSAAVPAGQELRLFDLDFVNTGPATSQFYGIKIQTKTDTIDTGAGIAIFDVGFSDAIYLNVAGKPGNKFGNNPTGIGIDVNKEVSSSAERSSANSSQQGIQIFDWSTTDQGIGGPRGMIIQKISNLNTDHLLMTLRSNRNQLQCIVKAGDAGYDATKPCITFNDETSGLTWWEIIASGEQVFNKNGIGIQWITPGGKTAYILVSTNDLKLKSGGTGIRFVNQADTQTIVMMQDDLSVDIPNNETRFQALKIVSDRIENTITNALASVSMNYNGYNGGTTQFRDFKVFDGKQNVIAEFTGTSRNFLFATATDKATTLPQTLISGGLSMWQDAAGAWNMGANAWHDGTNYKRLVAVNGAGLLYLARGACEVYYQTDVGNTVDSTITFNRYYHFGPTTIGFFGNGTSVKATVTGYTGGGTALGSLLTGLSGYGLITNSSTDGTPSGSMYADDISQAVTVASAGVYYEVPGSITGGTCNGFTFQSSKQLLAAVAGTYEVNWSMSITSANNNENIAGAAMVNSTEAHNTEGSAQCINAGKPVCVSGHGLIALAINDVVKFCVENEDAAHNITVLHANMSIKRIGA